MLKQPKSSLKQQAEAESPSDSTAETENRFQALEQQLAAVITTLNALQLGENSRTTILLQFRTLEIILNKVSAHMREAQEQIQNKEEFHKRHAPAKDRALRMKGYDTLHVYYESTIENFLNQQLYTKHMLNLSGQELQKGVDLLQDVQKKIREA